MANYEDDLAKLPKLGADAMGPCIKCKRQLLETGFPLFIRVHPRRCALDRNEISRHVGLALAMGGGEGGLTLAGVLGPRVEPVMVMDEFETVNHSVELAMEALGNPDSAVVFISKDRKF